MAYEPTREQRLILQHEPDRNGRVLAGPGTGKSTTVVDLVHRLLGRDPKPRIRLLTFTRAATAELAGKVAAHEAEVERPSTVHSFAISALLRNPGSAPFPEPLRIADDWELDKIIRPELAALTGVQPRLVKKRLLPEMAAMWMSLTPEEDPAVDEATRNRFIGAFRQHRRVMGYTLLGELPDLLRQALESYDDLEGLDYDFLVVDEYQDLNACDLRVLELLAERGVAIFAVGDDEQSIYGWRKAAPEGILRFPEDYPGADDYVLSVSHRCGSEIIAWARFVIEANPSRPPDRDRLVPVDGAPPGEVALLSFPSQITEARGVADLVENLIKSEGLAPSDILVMSRSDYNGQFSGPIKAELESRDIDVDDPSWVDDVVDGTQKRNYRCKGKRYDACDAPQVDAHKVDAAVVAHLEHLFIDVERWQADLARGAQEARGALEAAVSDARAALAKAEREVSRLGERYKTLDGAKADAVLDLLVAAREEKVAREGTVRQTEDALARVPVAPPTDEVLDLHSELARIVRGGDASDLNDRLGLVFDRFEIETLPDGRVLVLPFLREDLVDRYAAPDGYLRVLTSQGEQDPYSLIKMPPSAGPLIVLDELVTTAPNA